MVLEVIFGGFSGDLGSQTSFWMLGVAMVDYYGIYEKSNFVLFSNSKIFGRRELDLCPKSSESSVTRTIGNPIETAHGEYPVSMQKNARQ